MVWASNGNFQLVMDFEDTYGTSRAASSRAGFKLPFTSFDLSENQPPQQSNILGAGRHSGRPFYGNKVCQGTLVGPVDNGQAIGYILKAIFGAPTTTGSGDPYTHTFKIGTSTPSFLLEKGYTDLTTPEYLLYNGCKATGISFSFTPNGQLQYNLSIVAAGETPGTSAYQASPTDLSKPSAIYYPSDASVSEGGSPVTNIEEISFDFKNNCMLGYGLSGTGKATAASDGGPTIEGRIKAMFDAMTILTKGENHTESSLSVACTQTTHSITLSVDELEYDHRTPAINTPGGSYLDLSFIGYYVNAAAASDFKVVLLNATASYAG